MSTSRRSDDTSPTWGFLLGATVVLCLIIGAALYLVKNHPGPGFVKMAEPRITWESDVPNLQGAPCWRLVQQRGTSKLTLGVTCNWDKRRDWSWSR